MDLLKHLRVVPGFPKEGIEFYDITTILQSPEAYKYVNEKHYKLFMQMRLVVVEN